MMKYSFLILLIFMSFILIGASSCRKENTIHNTKSESMTNGKIKIIIGSQIFKANLLDNKSVNNFKEMLPLTINMTELNGNEKYHDFSMSLPTNSSNPGMINNGDLMLYGSKTLVLFYKSFSTSYNYTKLGKIDDVAGLASALGLGNVTVTFELES